MSITEVVGSQARLTAADIYNSAVASWAIAAAWEVGVLDEIHKAGAVQADELAVRLGLDPVAARGMYQALAAVEVITRDGDTVRQGPLFAEVNQYRSYFHWLSRGCSGLYTEMPTVLKRANRVGSFYQRDAAAISYACRELSTFSFDPAFWTAMERIPFSFSVVADLGCGSGERLIQIVRKYPGTRGLGIDIAPAAVEMTLAEAERNGFADRITAVRADARGLEPHPSYEEVEVLTCFMMGHDFWPREDAIERLSTLRELFPRVRRFLLGDATRTVGYADRDVPLFNLGFESAHDLMGQYIPTIDEWHGVFAETGWKLVGEEAITSPAASVVFELE
ncbi:MULTISPECIES: SAM-dependent methyltransferase [Streptomyces]|uniref:Methyltransferase domain-containing protein n=1 Tax=Streptomyces coeruleofuscus TaxID=66879 RepID=A0ABN3IB13_9ACTN